MKLRIIIIGLLVIGLSYQSYCQTEGTPAASRKANIKTMLDYRFRGGFYSFEKLFNMTINYPPMATTNCVMGIVVVAFEVDCNGNVGAIRMKTPLYYGIKEEISKFFDATAGYWNTCDDNRYTKFEIPIQFIMDGVQTNDEDGILICVGKAQGFSCNDDEYYLKRATKYLEKGSMKKALKNINTLIQRNPYNLEYYEMRKKALGESEDEE